MNTSIQAKNIERVLNKVPNVTSIVDLLGQDKEGRINEPSILFYILPHLYGKLLDNDPDKVLSKRSIKFRQRIIYKSMVRLAKFDLNGKELFIKKKSELPKGRPLIFASTHGFIEDATTIFFAAEKPGYYIFGSMPQVFNTIRGFSAYLLGAIFVNRKNKSSKKAVTDKAVRALELGANLYFYPEGCWNKSANLLTLKFWPGIIKTAKESNALIIPIVNLLVDQKIFVSRLEPFDVAKYNDDRLTEALDDLQVQFHSEIWNLMEENARIKRCDLLGNHSSATEMYENYLETLVASIGEYYDYSVESVSEFRQPGVSLPEDVWAPIAQLEINKNNVKDVLYARNLVAQRQREDFQRRF